MPKTVLIKDLTFDDKGLHLSILFLLFKTYSQRIYNETQKNTKEKKEFVITFAYLVYFKYFCCLSVKKKKQLWDYVWNMKLLNK